MVSHLSISFKINLRASIAGSRKDYAVCAGHYSYVSAKAQIAIRLECVRWSHQGNWPKFQSQPHADFELR